MRLYKTSEKDRERSRSDYHAKKNAGGEAFMAERRAYKKKWRADNPEKDRGRHRATKPWKPWLCQRARSRARRAGLTAEVYTKDLHWPTHCPVLGILLDYDTPKGSRKSSSPNLPSLDRWDSSKGYERGNVYVISMRANALKSNATPDELEAVAKYARFGPS